MTPERFWWWVGGRKFVLTMGSGIVNAFLLWHGKLTGEQFLVIILGTVGTYIGANAYQKVKTGAQSN